MGSHWPVLIGCTVAPQLESESILDPSAKLGGIMARVELRAMAIGVVVNSSGAWSGTGNLRATKNSAPSDDIPEDRTPTWPPCYAYTSRECHCVNGTSTVCVFK
jgi:hypothetical protein